MVLYACSLQGVVFHVPVVRGTLGDCPKRALMFAGFSWCLGVVLFLVLFVRVVGEKPFKADYGPGQSIVSDGVDW